MDNQTTSVQPEQDTQELTLNLEGKAAKKPRKKWIIISAIIAAVLIVAAIVTVVLIKNNANEPEVPVITIIDVEKQAQRNTLWDRFLLNEPMGQSVHFDVDINDLALSVIKKQFPDLEMLEQVDGISIDAVVEKNDGMMRLSLCADLPEESLPPIDILIDSNTQGLYVSSEMFSGNYLKFDLASLAESELDINLDDYLVDSSKDSAITEKYFDSFLELMSAQQTQVKTLTASGVSQECTVYSAEINVQELIQLLTGYLGKLKENNGVYSEIIDSIIEEIENGRSEDQKLDTLYWSVFTDDSGKIIGREIAYGEEQLFYYLQTVNGEDLGFEFFVHTFKAAGNAVLKDGLMDGTFMISVDGIDYLKISTDDFDTQAYMNGMPNGTIEFKPTDALMAELFGTDIGLPVSISAHFETTESYSNVTISLMEMVNISIGTSQFEPATITLPEGNEIDGSDLDALNKLLEGFSTGDET